MKPDTLSQSSGITLAQNLGLVALALILLGLVVPQLVPPSVTVSKSACINNLRQIEGAKEQWALEKKMTAGVLVVDSEVNAYIKGFGVICPHGGIYTYNAVGASPSCSLSANGHSL